MQTIENKSSANSRISHNNLDSLKFSVENPFKYQKMTKNKTPNDPHGVRLAKQSYGSRSNHRQRANWDLQKVTPVKSGKFTKRPAWPANKGDNTTTESLKVGPYSNSKMRKTAGAATESSSSAPRGNADDRANSAEHIKIHDEVDDQVVMMTDPNTEPPAIMMNSSCMGEVEQTRQSVPMVPLAKLSKIK